METITIKLTGKYEGWQAEMDGDPDVQTFVDFQSGNFDRLLRALEGLLVSWNFRGKDGKEVPTSYDGLKRLSMRCLKALADAYGEQFGGELPN